MKTPFFHFVLCLIVSCLFYITNNQTVAALLSTVEDFCDIVDYKPDNRHYARTFASNLNVGEPRTVRLVYFLPNDRPYREEVVQRMKDEILNIQAFYAEAMQAHGYQDMTFKIETDAQRTPVVHRVDGQHPEIHYIGSRMDTVNTVYGEIEQTFDFTNNIYFIVIDYSIDSIGLPRIAAGVGEKRGKNGGVMLIPALRIEDRAASHELGHTFGLQHDFRHGTYIMSYGPGRNRSVGHNGKTQLSECNADFLAAHPYFNSDIPTERGWRPIIELTSPSTYPSSSESVDIQLKVTDSEGIHQVILFVKTSGPSNTAGAFEVKSHRKLAGEKEVVVSFEYDGDIPSSNFTVLSMYPSHKIYIAAIDMEGDVRFKNFTLSEISPEQSPSIPKTLVKTLGDNQTQAIHSNYETWGLPAGAKVRIGKGTPGPSDTAVAFSPNGQYLAVASSIGVWLYDTVSYQELALLPSQGAISSVAFSPDGSAIAATAQYSNLKGQVWDILTRKKLATFTSGGSGAVIAFSADGKTIAYSAGKKIILCDVTTEQEIVRMESENYIDTISFSPDGYMIASAGKGNLIKLWDTLTGQEINTFNHKSNVNSIAFSPNKYILASGSSDTTVKLWDAITGTEILTIENPYRISAVTFSSDGKTLAWTGAGNRSRNLPDTIHLWDMETHSPIATYEDPNVQSIDSIAFSPDGKTLATTHGFTNTTARVLDIDTGNAIDLGHTPLGAIPLGSISFSPDSTILASCGHSRLKLWNTNTGQIIANVSESTVNLVSFSPDGKTLAYRVRGEDFVRLWDVTTQTQIGIIENDSINGFTFSPDGKTLALKLYLAIELYDVAIRQSIAKFEGHTNRITSIVFSPDGKFLASTSEDYTVKLWDVETKQIIENFVEEYWTSFATFSHDGTILGFCTRSYTGRRGNKVAKLWDMTTREFIATQEADCIAFSPNSTIMILENQDNSISFWDTKTLTLITTFEGDWHSPMFSPDGKMIASLTRSRILLADIGKLNNQFTPAAPSIVNFTNILQTELLLNYPNPFNPETWIPFRLIEDATVTLTIYDKVGHIVRSLDLGHKKAGAYETRNKAIYWDGKNDLGENVASGVYFYHLKAGEYSATRRMVILK